jgi:hypothetical protein
MSDFVTRGFGLATFAAILLAVISFSKHQYAAGTTSVVGTVALIGITVWAYRRDQRRRGFRQ